MTVSILMTMLFVGGASADSYTMAKGTEKDIYYVYEGNTQYNVASVQNNSDPTKVDHAVYDHTTSGKRIHLTAKEVGTSVLTVNYFTSSGSIASTTVTVTVSYNNSSQTTRQISLASLNDYHTSTEKFTNVWDASFSDSSIATYSFSPSSLGNSIIITGKKTGSTTFTFWSTDTSGNNVRYTYNITVGSDNGGSTRPTVNLKTGETYYISPENSNFQLASNNPTNIATMSKTNDNRILITAVSVGNTSLNYSYVNGGNVYSVTVPVAVTTNGASPTSNTINLTVGQLYTQNYTSVGISTNSNPNVATAKVSSVTGGQQLTVTGVSAGSTTITLVYSSGSSNGTLTLTVNVTGSGSGGSAVNSETTGIYFKSSAINIPTAKKYRISGIKLNGSAIKAADLLWISTNTSVVAVGSATGIFQGKKSGSAKLIAVDKDGKYVNAINVTVK